MDEPNSLEETAPAPDLSDRGEGERKSMRRRSVLLDYMRTIAVALPLALFLRVSVVEAYRIPSGSMEDTILVGDRLIVNKFIYGAHVPFLGWRMGAIREPHPGEVIVFRSPIEPGVNFIKRCVAVEGQTVEIKHKKVFVDGQPMPLPAHGKADPRHALPTMDNLAPVVVPPGCLFVLGDNRDNSTDSRSWGFLERDNVLGKALMIYWSYDPSRDGAFWSRIRWQRIGDRVL
jgi:signal peptidase I